VVSRLLKDRETLFSFSEASADTRQKWPGGFDAVRDGIFKISLTAELCPSTCLLHPRVFLVFDLRLNPSPKIMLN
jgi:hypothetical protein